MRKKEEEIVSYYQARYTLSNKGLPAKLRRVTQNFNQVHKLVQNFHKLAQYTDELHKLAENFRLPPQNRPLLAENLRRLPRELDLIVEKLRRVTQDFDGLPDKLCKLRQSVQNILNDSQITPQTSSLKGMQGDSSPSQLPPC